MNFEMASIKQKLKKLPLCPGVYLMKNESGEVIYVGKSKLLKNRVSQYFMQSKNHSPKTMAMVSNVYDFDYIEYEKYLKDVKAKKIKILMTQILLFIGFIVLWEVLANNNIINTFLFSSPKDILNTLIKLFNNDLLTHIRVTTYETLTSFIISSLLGIIIAAILWLNKTFAKIIEPYLTVINSLPKVALGPLIIIWVGASTNSIIFMSLLISTFVTIINIYNGFNRLYHNE